MCFGGSLDKVNLITTPVPACRPCHAPKLMGKKMETPALKPIKPESAP